MGAMSNAIKDSSRDDSPDRTPSSAYMPSSSAPWLTNAGGPGSGGSGAAGGLTGSSAFKSPAATATGGSWWDKQAAVADAPSSGGTWGGTAAGKVRF